MVVAFVFLGLHCNFMVCILSRDIIGHGVTWQSILLYSHMIRIRMGLTSILSHRFTGKSESLEIQMHYK